MYIKGAKTYVKGPLWASSLLCGGPTWAQRTIFLLGVLTYDPFGMPLATFLGILGRIEWKLGTLMET